MNAVSTGEQVAFWFLGSLAVVGALGMVLARNAIPWSLVGFPAISVPVGTVEGLPVGLQLVAPPHQGVVRLAVTD